MHRPSRIGITDIDDINRVFSDAFTDRYRRDGLVGVRVPRLNPAIWRYALEGAGTGAMLWRDERGQVMAFNVAHCSGREGWMGPLAVRTDRQGFGLGQVVVMSAVKWLQSRSASTIGLETMPRTVDNIGFYSRLGFLPGHLTVTAVGDVRPRVATDIPFVRLSNLSRTHQEELIAGCRARLDQSAPGYDFSRELMLTEELGVGDTIVLEQGGIRGFALWHHAALVEARPPEELRLLKLFADSRETLDSLLAVLEVCATEVALGRIAVRAQTRFRDAYTLLVQRGYRVRWTDLRMTLEGYDSLTLPQGEVLFSNWEI
jgi:GNAT superfamily N-acetyltransferase